MIPVAILAGGLATRLRPITTTIPKALAEVAGHPFIHWQLQDLAVQGAHDVVMLVGYLGEQIEKEIGNGHQYGLNIRYVFDGPTLLGTGGALRQALPLLGDAFFVLYGDSFLQVNYQAVEAAFIKSGQRALMTVLKNGNQWDK
ncbi:MAG: nucleotidyl transferase, partial [Alphaproteobacteria bacterium]|nr:nucleotidyl transferase [Alphaproteobacteria bacterium]